MIWRYVERRDLGVLEEAIKARAHTPGRAPASPRLVLALWLYATNQGVYNTRALVWPRDSHDAYRWLCGVVSVNYHGLANFRSSQGELLDRLLVHNIAALMADGLIALPEVVQDGARAGAGASSFRRRQGLHKHLKEALRLVECLKQETAEAPEASNRRIKAALERATREQRVTAALYMLREIEAEGERRGKTDKKQVAKRKEPCASTADCQARVMKMADGSFGPADNCKLGRVVEGQIVVDLGVDDTGSDRGLLRLMLERLKEHFDRYPRRYLVVGRFNKNDDTEWAVRQGVLACGPGVNNKHNTDPYQPGPDDGPGALAWHRRMPSSRGKRVYKRRAIGERINARFRQRGLRQFTALCSKGQTIAALVRPGKQHIGRTSPRIRQRMTGKSPTPATVTLADGARRGACSIPKMTTCETCAESSAYTYKLEVDT